MQSPGMGHSAKFYKGRLRSEVQPGVTLLYTIFDSKGTCTPFIYLPLKSGTPSLERFITKPGNFLNFFTTKNSSISLFKVFCRWKDKFPYSFICSVLQLVKSITFHISEALKRYPFSVEPLCIGHYRSTPQDAMYM